MPGIILVLEAFVFSFSCSVDAFAASFAYGGNKIKIPISSALIINIICSSILGISLLLGSFIKPYLPLKLTSYICFAIFFIIGIIKLFDSAVKSIIRKYSHFKKELEFSLFNIKFILYLYANPEEADTDSSNDISFKESSALAVSLSLDGMAAGFGAAIGNTNGFYVFIFSLIINMFVIILGSYAGNKIASKSPFNLSWISGIILICMAVMKLM